MSISITQSITRPFGYGKHVNYVMFCGVQNAQNSDSNKHENETEIKNLYNGETLFLPKNIDLTKAQNIELKTKNNKVGLVMDYDPRRKTFINDTKERISKEAVILKSKNPRKYDEFGIHIMSKDLKTVYGQVLYSEFRNGVQSGVEEVYIEHGDKNISGINKIADKYAIHYCEENNLAKNVYIYAKPEEYRVNYDEGKRFVVPEKGSNQHIFLIKNYKNADPNEIIKNDRVDTSEWLSMKMYLPSENAEKYSSVYTLNGIQFENPITNWTYYSEEYVDLSEPQTIICKTRKLNSLTCSLSIDPKRVGYIYNKETGEPVEVLIAELHDSRYKDEVAFLFVSKDFREHYGYVMLDKDYKSYGFEELSKSYPDEGIKGDRIVVFYLENYNDKKYGGVGILADKVAVSYCVNNNIPTNIVSIAGKDSHIAHYSRGKRFLSPLYNSDGYNFLMEKYGTSDPNKVLDEKYRESKKTKQSADLSNWDNHIFFMYLPKHLVDKYKRENILGSKRESCE